MITATDMYLMRLAYEQARLSPDLSTQNGAVLVDPAGCVIGVGHNRIVPPTCATADRLQRPAKYLWTEHAERDAIYDAARCGCGTAGATLYAPWLACADCGRAIVLSGITRVVRHRIPQHADRPDWEASIAVADEMMAHAHVTVDEIDVPLGVTFRFNGQEITA